MLDFRQIDKPRHGAFLTNKPQELTDDLTASELAEMLEGLRFRGEERRLVASIAACATTCCARSNRDDAALASSPKAES